MNIQGVQNFMLQLFSRENMQNTEKSTTVKFNEIEYNLKPVF